MILVVKQNHDKQQFKKLTQALEELGLEVHQSHGTNSTVLGLVGDTSLVDIERLRSMDMVESVMRISEPYKKANRKFHPEDTVIEAGGKKIGGDNFSVMAGPCSVESEKQIIEVAEAVKASGADFLRGGAFKPRTSPYAFQGLKGEGLKLMLKAKQETGMGIVTEIMSASLIEFFEDVDIIQVGTRNMQNFDLLKELGKTNKPILLKRGMSNTIEEWLMSAEYIMSEGNENVILCERGIRTFETFTRNTLDISAISILKELTHLPVIVDPSHATGISRLVAPMSYSSIVAGADGLIIEVHNDPKNALCDGAQSLTPAQFDELSQNINKFLPLVGKVR